MDIKLSYRNLVLIPLGLLLALAVGCSGHKGNTEKKTAKTTDEYYGRSKVDFKKAALLNVELAEGYLAQGQTIRAKKKLLHALELDPNLAEGLAAMGFFWEKVGELKEAEIYYKKAITQGKGKGDFYNHYANFLCRVSRYKEADEIFNKAFNDKNYLNIAEAYENAGMCSLDAVEYKRAEKYFSKAIVYDNRRFNSWVELTDLAFRFGELEKAADYLKTFRKKTEPSARLLWLSIQIANARNDQDIVASEALLLKNLFANSAEYQLYQTRNAIK